MFLCPIEKLLAHKSYSHLEPIPQTKDVCLSGYGWKVMLFAEGIDSRLLTKIYNSFTRYLSIHSKVFMIRFDISLYDSPSTNKTVSKIIQRITFNLDKRYQSKASYGWVREQNTIGRKCHYHCFILLDGHKVNRSKTTFDFASQAITLVIDATVYFPKSPCYMTYRSKLRSQQAAIYRLSYLAKNASKDTIPSNTKGSQFSRINMNELNILSD